MSFSTEVTDVSPFRNSESEVNRAANVWLTVLDVSCDVCFCNSCTIEVKALIRGSAESRCVSNWGISEGILAVAAFF